MVFYLKYRPKKISDLDSVLLREKLENVLKGKLPDKISHAYLFTGPKGLGKTSTARILAKVLNCTTRKGEEFEPCNKCDSCKSIDLGSNLDVLEIDAASNRGIDEIRDLREKIRLSPVSSLKKVYIIDEVHMLTTEAFNALLKTLEEPPAHAVFILCTTEQQKIPETITSRCTHIRFSRATDEELVSSFKRIVKGEGIKADLDALLLIAQMSDGSFRDGAKILEEISSEKTNIDIKTVEGKYNFTSVNKSVTELIQALNEKDLKKGIGIVSSLEKDGVDFKLFTEKVIDTLHKKLISQIDQNSTEAIQTKNLITMLVKVHISIKYAVLPQLPLELTIVEWCSQDVENTEVGIKNQELSVGVSKVERVKTDNEPAREETPDIKNSSSQPSSGNDKILLELIDKVKKENFSVAGVLRGCSVEKYDRKTLVLSTEFIFHKERLSDKKVLDMLEKFMEEITQEKTKISIELKG